MMTLKRNFRRSPNEGIWWMSSAPANRPSLTGFASGYLSRAYGRQVLCLEERCRGKGDALCSLVARYREDWGEEIAAQLRPRVTLPPSVSTSANHPPEARGRPLQRRVVGRRAPARQPEFTPPPTSWATVRSTALLRVRRTP